MSNHRSYYINVGQIFTVAVGGILAWRALKLEEEKAWIQHRSVMEVMKDDWDRLKNWLSGHRIEVV